MKIITKQIEIEYTDGRKIVIEPYPVRSGFEYGFHYYNKKGIEEEYEGGWRNEQVISWLTEILEDDNEREINVSLT